MTNINDSAAWAGEKTTTTIDLIRHGEPEGGVKYRGHRDDPLSDLGWEQMRNAVGDYAPWDRIVSSPLLRCSEFAVEVAGRLALPLSIRPGFKEVNFGCWEGRTAAELSAESPGCIERFWHDPTRHAPAGGEPFADFDARIAQAWRELVADFSGEHLLLVCHGGVIRTLVHQVLQTPLENLFRLNVSFAAVSRIRIVTSSDGLPMTSVIFHDGELERRQGG